MGTRIRKSIACLLVLLGCLLPAPLSARAGASSLGDEFRVNSTSTGDQKNPSAAGISGGKFVVVWAHQELEGPDNWDIYGQIFDSDNNKYGTEFRCNTTTDEDQTAPDLAALDDGFVAVWLAEHPDYAGSTAVVFQIFDSSGNKSGSETPVLRWNGVNHTAPAVTALNNNRFMVVWGAGSGSNLVGKVFTASGDAVGDHFQVSGQSDLNPSDPDAALLGNGNVVVVWRYQGGDDDLYSVYGQIVDPSSRSRVGGEFRINSYQQDSQLEPAVASLSGGGFVVVWSSFGQDGSGYGIYGQIFDNDGNKRGDEFQANTHTSEAQQAPRVVGLSGGGFVVTWESLGQVSSGKYSIHGQVFDSSGAKQGDEFQVNSDEDNDKDNGAVASLSDNKFLAVWSSDGQDGGDWGVYGRRFEATSDSGGGSGSTSKVEQFVTRFYNHCLLRDPDDEGLAYWVAELESGRKTGADVARGFIHSTEFVNRNTSDADYVTILYRAFFGREPDVAGYNYWMNRLETGSTRDEVLDGFIYSYEFVKLCEDYEITPY